MVVVLKPFAHHEPGHREVVARSVRRVEVAPAEAVTQAVDQPAAERVAHDSEEVAGAKKPPIERRAEAATIAWLRHATTAYDHMVIPRIKGRRREVRRRLADRSRKLLGRYRRGEPIAAADCPLLRGLSTSGES